MHLLERVDPLDAVLARERIGDLRQPILLALQIVGERVPRPSGEAPVGVAERDDVVAERER